MGYCFTLRLKQNKNGILRLTKDKGYRNKADVFLWAFALKGGDERSQYVNITYYLQVKEKYNQWKYCAVIFRPAIKIITWDNCGNIFWYQLSKT